jgi:hypothetical protein
VSRAQATSCVMGTSLKISHLGTRLETREVLVRARVLLQKALKINKQGLELSTLLGVFSLKSASFMRKARCCCVASPSIRTEENRRHAWLLGYFLITGSVCSPGKVVGISQNRLRRDACCLVHFQHPVCSRAQPYGRLQSSHLLKVK